MADGNLHLTLTEDEISILEGVGLPVTRGTELQVRDVRNDVGGGALGIATGLVTGYLDTPGVGL